MAKLPVLQALKAESSGGPLEETVPSHVFTVTLPLFLLSASTVNLCPLDETMLLDQILACAQVFFSKARLGKKGVITFLSISFKYISSFSKIAFLVFKWPFSYNSGGSL